MLFLESLRCFQIEMEPKKNIFVFRVKNLTKQKNMTKNKTRTWYSLLNFHSCFSLYIIDEDPRTIKEVVY